MEGLYFAPGAALGNKKVPPEPVMRQRCNTLTFGHVAMKFPFNIFDTPSHVF